MASELHWSKRVLKDQIERKAFERTEIADTKLTLANANHLTGNFKDPYFLDFLGLKEGYLENELENAILKELELFILELGNSFAFVELLNMQKDNIMVAEYWTNLPPKELLEQKLHNALIEVRERIAERKLLETGGKS